MHTKKLSCLQSGTFLIWEMPKMVGNVEFSLLALLQDTTITSAQPPINAQQTKTGARAARPAGCGNATKWG